MPEFQRPSLGTLPAQCSRSAKGSFKGSHSLRPACTSKALRSNLTSWITINFCNGWEAMLFRSANIQLPQVDGLPIKIKKTKSERGDTSLGLNHLLEYHSITVALLGNTHSRSQSRSEFLQNNRPYCFQLNDFMSNTEVKN